MRKWAHALTAALVIALLVGGVPVDGLQNARAENSGLERTPVLGWSSWSFLREHPTAAKIEPKHAHYRVRLQKIGYNT